MNFTIGNGKSAMTRDLASDVAAMKPETNRAFSMRGLASRLFAARGK